jgi:hypothetical protein
LLLYTCDDDNDDNNAAADYDGDEDGGCGVYDSVVNMLSFFSFSFFFSNKRYCVVFFKELKVQKIYM